MSEIFAAPECTLHLWTGSHTASGGAMVYAENVSVSLTMEYDTTPSLSGTYRDHAIGKRAEISIGRAYNLSAIYDKWLTSATAVHFKATMNHYGGSAGVILYSGRLDNVTLAGSMNGVMSQQIQGHANIWTGF